MNERRSRDWRANLSQADAEESHGWGGEISDGVVFPAERAPEIIHVVVK